mgnify:CR=1 FL=1
MISKITFLISQIVFVQISFVQLCIALWALRILINVLDNAFFGIVLAQ